MKGWSLHICFASHSITSNVAQVLFLLMIRMSGLVIAAPPKRGNNSLAITSKAHKLMLPSSDRKGAESSSPVVRPRSSPDRMAFLHPRHSGQIDRRILTNRDARAVTEARGHAGVSRIRHLVRHDNVYAALVKGTYARAGSQIAADRPMASALEASETAERNRTDRQSPNGNPLRPRKAG